MTPPRFDALLVTCEHATNAVPARFKRAFARRPGVLKTHRGWDPGAAVLARELEHAFGVKAHYGRMTRLLIDLNRREQSPTLCSEFTPHEARTALIETYHRPWREAVLAEARELCRKGLLLHVSCHSFVPAWLGVVREVDIALLYDPRRKLERETALEWQHGLRQTRPGFRVRRNFPYRGVTDGVCTWLRKQLPANRYAGLEIEMNHLFSALPARQWGDIRAAIVAAARANIGVPAGKR
ncbi:MAG: N-formylglutamate amidohydrolase [Planctomycetes bacterium]|nr:N-formylglutamate amidohydrolase [Planctomycetota bacterium]